MKGIEASISMLRKAAAQGGCVCCMNPPSANERVVREVDVTSPDRQVSPEPPLPPVSPPERQVSPKGDVRSIVKDILMKEERQVSPKGDVRSIVKDILMKQDVTTVPQAEMGADSAPDVTVVEEGSKDEVANVETEEEKEEKKEEAEEEDGKKKTEVEEEEQEEAAAKAEALGTVTSLKRATTLFGLAKTETHSWTMTTAAECVKQFNDREYILTGLPPYLVGASLLQGPCVHECGDEINIHPFHPVAGKMVSVYVLVSHGCRCPPDEMSKLFPMSLDWKQIFQPDMGTTSFDVKGFDVFRKDITEPLSEPLRLKLTTQVELSVALKEFKEEMNAETEEKETKEEEEVEEEEEQEEAAEADQGSCEIDGTCEIKRLDILRFEVHLEKRDANNFGVTHSPMKDGSQSLLIVEIQKGFSPIDRYNTEQRSDGKPQNVVQRGDRIVAVDDLVDLEGMKQALREDEVFLTVERWPGEIHVHLTKEVLTDKYGMQTDLIVRDDGSKVLRVGRIAGGLLSEWNTMAAEARRFSDVVGPFCEILSVNGKKNPERMQKLLVDQLMVDVCFKRPDPELYKLQL